ncbi:MAG TPA: hypothetical protein VF070_43265 [Streptosporangiaceae bacterium]
MRPARSTDLDARCRPALLSVQQAQVPRQAVLDLSHNLSKLAEILTDADS